MKFALTQRLHRSTMRAYAWVFVKAGGALTRSAVRDIEDGSTTRNLAGITVMAESKERLEDVAKAFELLREKDRYALGLIKRWIERICFANFPKARVHYCDGTLLLKSENELPVSVLAAFLYRLAVEVMLVKRFGRLETLLTWRPDILIGLRKELRLLRKLSAPQS